MCIYGEDIFLYNVSDLMDIQLSTFFYLILNYIFCFLRVYVLIMLLNMLLDKTEQAYSRISLGRVWLWELGSYLYSWNCSHPGLQVRALFIVVQCVLILWIYPPIHFYGERRYHLTYSSLTHYRLCVFLMKQHSL